MSCSISHQFDLKLLFGEGKFVFSIFDVAYYLHRSLYKRKQYPVAFSFTLSLYDGTYLGLACVHLAVEYHEGHRQREEQWHRSTRSRNLQDSRNGRNQPMLLSCRLIW